MKKIRVFILLLAGLACSSLLAEEITEENYLKLDKEIWDRFGKVQEDISNQYNQMPEKKDSFLVILQKELEIADKANINAAIKFATTRSGLQRLFMVRLSIPKDKMKSIYDELPDSMKRSDYGKSIAMHIATSQIEKGSKVVEVEGVDVDNQKFSLKDNLRAKNLLIYDGLSCMGDEGRDFLNKIIADYSVNIIAYISCSDIKSLKEIKEKYNIPFKVFSDFQYDSSPFKIIYGAQNRPTCFLIDENGIVIDKFTGVKEDIILPFCKK